MDGRTPLHKAAYKGQKEVAICLISHGANFDAADNLGGTSLMLASQNHHLSLVDLLLLRGANPNMESNMSRQTALHVASGRRGDFKIAWRLLEGGSLVNQMDRTGVSPLQLAAQEGHIEIVKLLVKKGANIHQATHQGGTPLDSAILYGHEKIANFLRGKGACNEENAAKACKYCGVTAVQLLKCSGCKVVWYCSPECQKKDWKEGGENKHKIQCPRIKEERELHNEEAEGRLQMERMAMDVIQRLQYGGGASISR